MLLCAEEGASFPVLLVDGATHKSRDGPGRV